MKRYFVVLAVLTVGFSLRQSDQVAGEVAPVSDRSHYRMIQFKRDAPPLYPWLLKPDSTRADWLGIKYENKTLHEPINVIIGDGFSGSREEAEAKLMRACIEADYLDRYGHSSDYLAYVDGNFEGQYPKVKKHSFSDKIFIETNNHGRIFGPVTYRGKYWFVAAFSREKVHIKPVGHYYVSFNQARDNFAWKLDRGTYYRVRKFVNLDNVIVNSLAESSGDHDGIAVYLEAVQ